MSRPGEPIVVKPSNNVYTALLGAAAAVVAIGLVVVLMRAATIFPGQGLL
jgi:hypothetical protein